jgi:cytochrome aa3 quinol oxidase subunit IV
MASSDDPSNPKHNGLGLLAPHFAPERFPWPQILGYIVSLILTFAALALVMHHVMPPLGLLIVILILAVGQAAVQLGLFMHLKEARGPAWQMIPLGLAFLIAIGLVGMSIWIMLFKYGDF